MASQSALVQSCITQVQSDGVANTDIGATLYVPQIEHIIVSVFKALVANAGFTAADNTILNSAVTTAASDPA